MNKPRLRILGIRGVPARHGGFETFAEKLAPYLVSRGWDVTVYCQDEGAGPVREDYWEGVRRITIPSGEDTAANTILFDWKANRHAAKSEGVCLTLGYNTALFSGLLRMAGRPNVINMDGIEYTRAKWGPMAKIWFRFNEWAACRLSHRMIADHPEIKKHLAKSAPEDKITTIAYGGEAVSGVSASYIRNLGLEPKTYLTVIARPEPENSLLEIVTGFSERRRGVKLVVLGRYDPGNDYHAAVQSAASDEVVFLGAIYDKQVVQALRYHALAYVHGHQVGGSNPSLIEALAAGNAVVAHDNRFNRWVAGPGAVYFSSSNGLSEVLSTTLTNPNGLEDMRASSKQKFVANFQWADILRSYEELLLQHVKRKARQPATVAAN